MFEFSHLYTITTVIVKRLSSTLCWFDGIPETCCDVCILLDAKFLASFAMLLHSFLAKNINYFEIVLMS